MGPAFVKPSRSVPYLYGSNVFVLGGEKLRFWQSCLIPVNIFNGNECRLDLSQVAAVELRYVLPASIGTDAEVRDETQKLDPFSKNNLVCLSQAAGASVQEATFPHPNKV